MWNCESCDVRFAFESVERHLYLNHIEPVSKTGSNVVYRCGECQFSSGDGFQDIAVHCIRFGHEPNRRESTFASYDPTYASLLFTALNEAMMPPLENKPSTTLKNDKAEPIVAIDGPIISNADFMANSETFLVPPNTSGINQSQLLDHSEINQSHSTYSGKINQSQSNYSGKINQSQSNYSEKINQSQSNNNNNNNSYINWSSNANNNNESSNEYESLPPLAHSTLLSISEPSPKMDSHSTKEWTVNPQKQQTGGGDGNQRNHSIANKIVDDERAAAWMNALSPPDDDLESSLDNSSFNFNGDDTESFSGVAENEDGSEPDPNQNIKGHKSSYKERNRKKAPPPPSPPSSSLSKRDFVYDDNGRKAFMCSFCPKTSVSAQAARYHERTHTGEKPYQCPECPERSFSRKDLLATHTETNHRHGEPRPFPCAACDKTFLTRRKLTVHERVHTGERPYACPACRRTFTQLANLNVHRRARHSASDSVRRPFTCIICEKSFSQNGDLQAHYRIHSGEKPFPCRACPNKRFSTSSNQRVHEAKCWRVKRQRNDSIAADSFGLDDL